MPAQRDLDPHRLGPYFALAALVHAAAIASRFDVLAAKLPGGAALAIMLAQLPLLMLSGYFEGRLAYGESLRSAPMWMRIEPRSVQLAFAFGFMYLGVVAAQTWDFRIGPIDPTPPETFPTATRALWFGMFTLGFSMLLFMTAAGVLIPIVRALTWPMRQLPAALGAGLAIAVGGGLGLVVLAAVQSTQIAVFVARVKATIEAEPAVLIGVTLAATIGPLLLGFVLERRRG